MILNSSLLRDIGRATLNLVISIIFGINIPTNRAENSLVIFPSQNH